ncbi:catechol 2,3-dioxygenase-like lactoylglutathione lyase family enzyme [Rhodoligotrophos appendicifer]|uniref:hypothetical protein n=1 Tax=Rhodoligotrophos appendicifer TaxID=987056 RepID=UPI001184EA6D|nr:hypothetical protein [Rhodoligotrophos appendicifer]
MADTPTFSGGSNVAMKLAPEEFGEAVVFYRDTLGLEVEFRSPGTAIVAFGPIRLWLDRVEGQRHAEIWLEVVTSDAEGAATVLKAAGVKRCDSVEPLPSGFRGFWIQNPAGLVHLVAEPDQND